MSGLEKGWGLGLDGIKGKYIRACAYLRISCDAFSKKWREVKSEQFYRRKNTQFTGIMPVVQNFMEIKGRN